VLADGEDYPIRKIQIDRNPEMRLKVYWVQGLSLPNSKNLVQLVNGRVLKDRVLQHAMMQPFRQSLLPGKFPALVGYLEMSPREMDVNVHPTKSEIRFLDSRKVFTIFDEALGMLIRTHGSGSFVGGDVPHFSTASETSIEPQKDSFSSSHSPSPQSFDFSSKAESTLHPALMAFRIENYLGVLFRTFLAFDLGDELGLIDQHAAHERIRYEHLKNRALRRAESSDVQDLLIPEVVKLEPSQQEVLEKRLPILSRLGFETEIFGPGQLLFRSIPPEWGNLELRTRLKSLVERLLALDEQTASSEQLFIDERLFEKIASEACRSSVRAGDRVEPWAARMLLEQLSECQHPWNCPHGRPTTARVPKARFEEWFQRIV